MKRERGKEAGVILDSSFVFGYFLFGSTCIAYLLAYLSTGTHCRVPTSKLKEVSNHRSACPFRRERRPWK